MKAGLAAIDAVVITIQMNSGESLVGSPRVEPAFSKQCFSLLRIAGAAHTLIVTTINVRQISSHEEPAVIVSRGVVYES